jgi:hypothetical protein
MERTQRNAATVQRGLSTRDALKGSRLAERSGAFSARRDKDQDSNYQTKRSPYNSTKEPEQRTPKSRVRGFQSRAESEELAPAAQTEALTNLNIDIGALNSGSGEKGAEFVQLQRNSPDPTEKFMALVREEWQHV